MPEQIRVLIVDDSSVVRRAVTEALSQDPEICVVGTAPNGHIALQRVSQFDPEVMILDINMPESDGFEVLRALRTQHGRLKIIMFSTLTERGAAQTIEALSLGASDYATKPSAMGQRGYAEALRQVAAELVPKVKQFRRGAVAAGPPSPPPAPSVSPFQDKGALKAEAAPKVVAMGLSTGGPEALSKCLRQIPQTFPLPILVVQHMPPVFTKLLAERLDANVPIKVVEAADGQALDPCTVYIAPGNLHMAVRREEDKVFVALNQAPPENSCRPSVDVLFRSVAEVYGSSAIGVIMTGMGQDGLLGARRLKAQGAVIVAQDEASSVVWGMPSYVVREGLADHVLSLAQVVPLIVDYAAKGAGLPPPGSSVGIPMAQGGN